MTQKEALDILKLGSNVFLTGTAGSGKTYVLQQYISYLKKKGICIGLTASTGVAATHIDGITINSWAGVGIKRELTEKDLQDLIKRRHLRKRFFPVKVLIIDEVSMLPDFTFRNIDIVCRAFKNSNLPFGGLQVILCGDFFQLPPVEKQDTPVLPIYKTALWNEMNLKICYLHKEYRQADEIFLQILRQIRQNAVDTKTIKLLTDRMDTPNSLIDTPTKLYTHNADVHAINKTELEKLSGSEHVFDMQTKGSEYLVEFMKKNSLAPEWLVLKKGALVMFVKNNFEKGYVNGTTGKVVDFSEQGYPQVELTNGTIVTASPAEWAIDEGGKVKAVIKQIPLRLAWAITIHKSQGMSLDTAEINLSNPFAPGIGYVALSRVKTLAGIRLTGFHKNALYVNKEVFAFDAMLQEMSKQTAKEVQQLAWLEKQVQQMEFIRKIKKKDKAIAYEYDHYSQLQFVMEV